MVAANEEVPDDGVAIPRSPRAPRRGTAAKHLGSAIVAVALLLAASAVRARDPLPSWNDGAAKRDILAFVAGTTSPGAPGFIPPAERIAVFDNDGTLWAEQPLYFQFAFVLDRVKALAPEHPEWKEKQPFKAVLEGDVKTALSGGEAAIGELMAATHAGMTTEEFAKIVADWIATARHPRLQRRYTECVYQPMLELLAHLQTNGFRTYIVSGGGVEFIRVTGRRTSESSTRRSPRIGPWSA